MTNKEFRQLHKTKPQFFYGYVIVISAFLIIVVSMGMYTVFGVFFKPIQNDFGWSSASISLAFSISMIVYGVLGFVVGGLNDRFGPRIVITGCGFLLGLGFLLMSQLNALWQIYLFFGIIGIGLSGVWVPQLSSVARWFVKRRNLMTGIVLSGVGIGQLIGSPVINRLITAYDWRISYVIMGSIVLIIMILLAQFMRRDPTQKGQLPYGASQVQQESLVNEAEVFSLKEAASTAQFWISFMILFCYGFCGMGLMVHIVPHVIDLGISAVTAANVLAINGGVAILGSNAMGSLGDKIGSRQVFIIGYILMAVSMLGIMQAREVWMLYLLASIVGFSQGGMGSAESPLVAWLFGLSSHGLIYGIIHIGFTAGAAVGPSLMGYIFDLTGGYQMAFLVGAAVTVIGIIITITLRPTRKT